MSILDGSTVTLETLVDPERPITYGIVLPGPDVPSGVPYVRVVDIQGGTIRADQLRRTSVEIARSYKRSSLVEGDLLVSIRGHVGRTALVPQVAEGANLTQDTARVAILPSVDRRYVRWFIESPIARRWLAQHTKGVAVTGINLGDLRRLPVPFCPLPEQRRIADLLDKSDAIRRKRKETISMTAEVLRSTFLEMFGDPVANPKGWPTRSVSDICDSKQYGTAEKANSEGRGLPVLRMNNLTYAGDIDISNLKWVELDSRDAQTLDLRAGDVLFNRVNSHELVGKTAVWHEGPGFTFAGYLIRLRVREDLATGDYVSAAMNLPSMKRTLMAMAKPSINMANISGSDLERLFLPVPPIALQRKYSKVRETVMKLRERYQAHSATAGTLFNSLVARAFGAPLTKGS